MKPAKIAVIVIAAIAAIGLALVVRSMGSSSSSTDKTEAAVQVAPMAKVLVAAVDLEPGRRLTAADMVWKDWPLADVNPAFVTDGSVPLPGAEAPKEDKAAKDAEKPGAAERVVDAVASLNSPTALDTFVGAVVRETILAGEPVVARKVVRAGESGYLAAFLEPGMKAMSIPVSVDTAAGGFILPGDRVDVLLTREVEAPNPLNPENTIKRNVSATVLQNMKVLAIDQTAQAPVDEKTVVGATATLEVNVRDAETLALARAEGSLTLLLRSYADSSGPRGLIPGAVRRGEVSARSSSVASAGSADNGRSVRVFRGDAAPEVVVLP